MKDKYMIFDANITGHHIEYLHHLYVGAKMCKEKNFVFLLPKSISDKTNWHPEENIKILYLEEDEEKKCNSKSLLITSLNRAIIIRKYAVKEHITHVFLIMLMLHIPLLLLFLPHKIQVSGIIYRIYFYIRTPIKKLLMERFRYFLMVRSKRMINIFILNDLQGVMRLNQIYHTKKFRYLPDPLPHFSLEKVHDIRKEFNIPASDTIFLHFGELTERKGTINILEAISMLSQSELEHKTFIFAGVVHDDIKNLFYSIISKNKFKSRILVFDKFCSYEFLACLCYSCNYILIPYKNINQSSGMLAWASIFSKPLVSPKEGL